jgi:hypothetical protein
MDKEQSGDEKEYLVNGRQRSSTDSKEDAEVLALQKNVSRCWSAASILFVLIFLAIFVMVSLALVQLSRVHGAASSGVCLGLSHNQCHNLVKALKGKIFSVHSRASLVHPTFQSRTLFTLDHEQEGQERVYSTGGELLIGDSPSRDNNPVPSGGVSVVIMNHGRPDNVRKIVPLLAAYTNISQIVLSHTNPETQYLAEELKHPKVTHRIDDHLDELYGVATRFKAAESVTSPWVVYLDDDILPSEESFALLLDEFSKDTNRIVGKWGRNFDIAPLYDTVDCKGNCSVVLTKFMILRTEAVHLFFDYARLLGMEQGFEDSRPRWNGEDIFMSLIHTKAFGGNNMAMPWLPVTTFKDDPNGKLSISARWTFTGVKHWWHRGYFWATVLAQLKDIPNMAYEVTYEVQDMTKECQGAQYVPGTCFSIPQISANNSMSDGNAEDGEEQDDGGSDSTAERPPHLFIYASNPSAAYRGHLKKAAENYQTPLHVLSGDDSEQANHGPVWYTQQILETACGLPSDTVIIKMEEDSILLKNPHLLAADFKENQSIPFVTSSLHNVPNHPFLSTMLGGLDKNTVCPRAPQQSLWGGIWITTAGFACTLRCAYGEFLETDTDEHVMGILHDAHPDLIGVDCSQRYFAVTQPALGEADTLLSTGSIGHPSHPSQLATPSILHAMDCQLDDKHTSLECGKSKHRRRDAGLGSFSSKINPFYGRLSEAATQCLANQDLRHSRRRQQGVFDSHTMHGQGHRATSSSTSLVAAFVAFVTLSFTNMESLEIL